MIQVLQNYYKIYGEKALYNYTELEEYLLNNNVELSVAHQIILVLSCGNVQATLERSSNTVTSVEINTMIVSCYQKSGLFPETIKTILFDILKSLSIECEYDSFYLPNENNNDIDSYDSLKITTTSFISHDEIKRGLNEAYSLHDSDPEEALRIYSTLAKCGSASAMLNIALFYYTGKGTEKNEEKAMKWFKAAAANGEPRANYYLGNYYYNNPDIIKRDFKKAYEYYTAPGGYFVHKDSKEKVTTILNKKTTNTITLVLSGIALFLMWLFIILLHTSVHNAINVIGWGITFSVIASIVFGMMIYIFKITLYRDVKYFIPVISILWAIYLLILVIN